MNLRTLFTELRRRRVIRAALLYLVAAWVTIQVASTVTPLLQLPDWTPRFVLVLAALAFPVLLVFAWVYDVTPAGFVATKPVARSIAVLPFADMSELHDHEHFGDGIAEEILNVLARLPDLRVSARTSAFAFKNKNEDVRRIGEQLGVATVLEGSVRVAGNRIRIVAQLIDVANGYHLWSERFDREVGDVFAIQDEIARSIAHALDTTMGGSPACDTCSSNIKAYDLYLRGRHYMQELRRARVEEARTMFLQATVADPNYASAFAAAAEASSNLFLYWDASPENLHAAEQYSERAITLSPNNLQALTAHAQVLSLQKKYAEAAREFEVVLRMDPLSYDAHYYYARSRWAAGDLKNAALHMRRAGEVRPEDFQAFALLTGILKGLGRPEEELEAGRIALERIEKHLVLYPDDARALYMGAGGLWLVGDRERADEFIERAARVDPNDAAINYNIGCYYARGGQMERALEKLEAAIRNGFAHREWVLNDGDWVALREDERFQRLVSLIPE